MRTIRYLIRKEFLQIRRNKTILPIIFIMPVVQLCILIYAATLDMKTIRMGVIDNDDSQTSNELISKFKGSLFYELSLMDYSVEEAEKQMKSGEIDVILQIPHNFEKNLVRENKNKVQLLINAINGTSAGLITSYSQAILTDFNKNIGVEWLGPRAVPKQKLNIITRFWFNRDLDYKIYMLPGILVILVTMIGMFLAGLNMVREKEIGTIEQINVTPIKKYQFIIAKLLPFWLIALFELTFGILIGKFFFNLPLLGDLVGLFAISSVYLVLVLSIGLFLSTLTNTQQQLMFLAYFFMLLFILMGGIFTPAENMPDWAQKVNYINPFAYYMRSIRMVLLKGSGFGDLTFEFGALSIYAFIMLSVASLNYRKTA